MTLSILRRLEAVLLPSGMSPTAIEWCRRRFPASSVTYLTTDLFAVPPAWRGIFDFFLESYTFRFFLPMCAREPCGTLGTLLRHRARSYSFAVVGRNQNHMALCHGRSHVGSSSLTLCLGCESFHSRITAMRRVHLFSDFVFSMIEPLNKSPEPTAVGAVSSAIAVHLVSRRWLSFLH